MASSSDKISVVVPVYNLEARLAPCVASIAAQTHSNLEILLVDDGSTDGSAEVICDLAKEDSRIRPIFANHGGALQARLTGIKAASGEWLGFVDGDDRLAPHMYETLLANAVTHGVTLAHCGYRRIFPDGVQDLYDTGVLTVQNCNEALSQMLAGERIEWWSMCNKLYCRTLFTEEIVDVLSRARIEENEDLLANFFLFTEAKTMVYEDRPLYFYQCDASLEKHAFSARKVLDRVYARELMLHHAEKSLRPQALPSYLRSIIAAYTQILLHNCDEGELRLLREKLKAEEKGFGLLDSDRAEIAYLISNAPEAYGALVGNRLCARSS